jgi:hypothetical protein
VLAQQLLHSVKFTACAAAQQALAAEAAAPQEAATTNCTSAATQQSCCPLHLLQLPQHAVYLGHLPPPLLLFLLLLAPVLQLLAARPTCCAHDSASRLPLSNSMLSTSGGLGFITKLFDFLYCLATAAAAAAVTTAHSCWYCHFMPVVL